MANITNEAIVYSRAIAYQLRLQGFKIIRVGVNPSCPQYDCYYFNNTPEFKQALQTIVRLNREAKQND
jgi:hypothetical protein